MPAGGLIALAVAAALLGGCASALSQLPEAVGGLPAGAPERPAETAAYPPVHDVAPARSTPVLSPAERKKTTDELAAARDEQARRAESGRTQ